MYYLYIVSCPAYAEQNICKIGCTNNPHDRIRPYFTSYPPGLPHYDIRYYKLWEINADNDEDMKEQEEIVHDEFAYQRLVRIEKSEWFHIENFLETVSQFIEKELNGNPIELPDIERKKRSPLETVVYKKNKKLFIRKEDQKNIKLNEIQAPVIQAIQDFIISDELAGQIIAPCGSGKTNMTCKAIQYLKRIVICVPSLRIQDQWYKTIGKSCLFVGGDSDDWNTIVEYLNSDEFCIITTYASCNKLVNVLPITTELIVFDEAHHMVGLVSDDKEKGLGITRVLLKTIAEKNLKRLFLTFTPKDANIEDDETILSMNKPEVFGNVIYELKLRSLIQQGVLPDYNVWILSSEGNGLKSKIDQIILAWNSNQFHHLVIFVEDLNDKEKIKTLLKEINCPVLSIENSKDANKVIEDYSSSERAILVDCKRLGEGVDIPIADSVAILYQKESIIEIVQMVLRAGRWYKTKSIFHVLLPHTIDEDMSGIQNVLYSLGKYDNALRGELLISLSTKSKDPLHVDRNIGLSSDHIQFEIFNSLDYEKMKECCKNIATRLIPKSNKKEIQKLCIQLNIQTSKEYEKLCKEFNHLPEDPRFNGTTWFDFLNPNVEKLDLKVFINTIIEKNLRLPSEYNEWYYQNGYPSLQNIRDGYFREDQTNFIELMEKFSPVERRRR